MKPTNIEIVFNFPILNDGFRSVYLENVSGDFQSDIHKLDFHNVKSGQIRSFSGTYFPAFRLNTEEYRVSLRI